MTLCLRFCGDSLQSIDQSECEGNDRMMPLVTFLILSFGRILLTSSVTNNHTGLKFKLRTDAYEFRLVVTGIII